MYILYRVESEESVHLCFRMQKIPVEFRPICVVSVHQMTLLDPELRFTGRLFDTSSMSSGVRSSGLVCVWVLDPCKFIWIFIVFAPSNDGTPHFNNFLSIPSRVLLHGFALGTPRHEFSFFPPFQTSITKIRHLL